jgi:hypothetical protein
MASLFSRVSSFAKSKQGKQLIDKAKEFAEDPKNRKKVTDAVSNISGSGKGRKPAKRKR